MLNTASKSIAATAFFLLQSDLSEQWVDYDDDDSNHGM